MTTYCNFVLVYIFALIVFPWIRWYNNYKILNQDSIYRLLSKSKIWCHENKSLISVPCLFLLCYGCNRPSNCIRGLKTLIALMIFPKIAALLWVVLINFDLQNHLVNSNRFYRYAYKVQIIQPLKADNRPFMLAARLKGIMCVSENLRVFT